MPSSQPIILMEYHPMKHLTFFTTLSACALLSFAGCASDGGSSASEASSLSGNLMKSLTSNLSTQSYDLKSLMSLTQLSSTPEGQQELAGKIVKALQGYLYGSPENIAAAAAEGRGVNLNEETLAVEVTDTVENQTKTLDFFSQLQGLTTMEGLMGKLQELALGKSNSAAAEGDVQPVEAQQQSVDYALIGDITPGSANLTIKTAAAGSYELALVNAAGTSTPLSFSTSQLPGTATYRGTLTATGLSEGTEYTLTFGEQTLATFHTLELDKQTVRLFFGSCTDYDQQTIKETYSSDENAPKPLEIPNHQLWSTITEQQFDAAYFIGDRFYLPQYYEDYNSLSNEQFMAMIDEYHEGMMNIPGMKPFLAQTPFYVTWDDHDFGPNNSAEDFVFSPQVYDYTKWSLPQPQMGTEELKGAYFKSDFGDLDVFVLDGRTYRDCSGRTITRNDKQRHSCGVDGVLQENGEYKPDELLQDLYGDQQMAWLQDQLKKSDAAVKLIVTGNQSMNNISKYEAWYHYAERQEFLDWMNQSKIPGVVFVGGDRHHGEVGVLSTGGPYPLYELTASGMGTNTYPGDVDTEASPFNVLGVASIQHYGVVEYSKPEGTVSLVLVGRDGKEVHRTVVNVAELN